MSNLSDTGITTTGAASPTAVAPRGLAGLPAVAGLIRLGLPQEEFAALARQGFVSAEPRRDGRTYYKLRYRRGGRQVVVGLGYDLHTAEQLRQELEGLQGPRRADRNLARLMRTARQRLCRSKTELASHLRSAGYHFHGYEIRRRRGWTDTPAAPRGPTTSEITISGTTVEHGCSTSKQF
jgi:hypothetical protein